MTTYNVSADNPTDALRRLAEATLGWPITNPNRFIYNARRYGLGEALNLEHQYLD